MEVKYGITVKSFVFLNDNVKGRFKLVFLSSIVVFEYIKRNKPSSPLEGRAEK